MADTLVIVKQDENHIIARVIEGGSLSTVIITDMTTQDAASSANTHIRSLLESLNVDYWDECIEATESFTFGD